MEETPELVSVVEAQAAVALEKQDRTAYPTTPFVEVTALRYGVSSMLAAALALATMARFLEARAAAAT